MLIPLSGAAGAAGVVGGGSAPPAPTVSITPSAVQAGQTLTCSPSAAGATSYTYQWTNNGGNIPGATSSTYANDGTFGSTAINCRVVAHNASGSSPSAEAAANRTIRWIGFISADGNNNTTAANIDTGSVLPGQVYFLVAEGSAPAGTLTIEGVGPTAISSHAHYKSNSGATGSKTTYVWSNSSTDQTFNYQFSSNWGAHRVAFLFKAVGYSETPGALMSAGLTDSTSNPSTATINVENNNGGVLAVAGIYDGLSNPSGIQHFSGSTFQKFTVDDYCAAGCGYLTTANGALGVTATKSAPGNANKHMCAIPLVPV